MAFFDSLVNINVRSPLSLSTGSGQALSRDVLDHQPGFHESVPISSKDYSPISRASTSSAERIRFHASWEPRSLTSRNDAYSGKAFQSANAALTRPAASAVPASGVTTSAERCIA